MKEYVMGNGAIALGALSAGINLAAGYPGTPSSEIIETIAAHPHEGVHVEWSVNEKAAMEVAAAGAYSGARCLVTMKQVGLNVASDPLMSLAYVGVKGGMVIVSADDPGPISSQTEQDTRRFGEFARIPVFDPSSPEEAYAMTLDAFELSEKYHTPVLLRPTTRVCHAYASIDVPEKTLPGSYEGFIKDTQKWVIFPRLSYQNHGLIEERNVTISDEFSSCRFNTLEGTSSGKIVAASGISFAYAKEFLKGHPEVPLLRIGTPFPFPERFALEAIRDAEEVLCLEELSPFMEEHLLQLAGKHHLKTVISGKLNGKVPHNGELSVNKIGEILSVFLDLDTSAPGLDLSDMPALPARPPVLCAGCPHRASFYAVKQATKGRKAIYCGDIGCYTLGNAMPLDMTDTCLCMGAGVNMAQGFNHLAPDTETYAFVGDSTFFASGITGVVNGVYNNANMTLVVLDNSTTAMTGHQPHPGTGRNMMGDIVAKISIEKILEGIGLTRILTVDPLDLPAAVAAVKECQELPGVKAIIFKSPCIALIRSSGSCTIDKNSCINCRKCIREIGCPGLIISDGQVSIDSSLCTGCGLCSQICPVHAIGGACHE